MKYNVREINICECKWGGRSKFCSIVTKGHPEEVKVNFFMKLKVNLHKAQKSNFGGFPGGAVVENLPANAGDTGSSPGLGGSHMPRSN